MKAKIDAIPVLESQKQNSGKLFAFLPLDFTASDTAKLTNISVRSIHTIYIKLHKRSLSSVKKYLPSMGSNPVGAMPKSGWLNSMELTKSCLICILNRWSIASIIGMVIYILICWNYAVITLFNFLSPNVYTKKRFDFLKKRFEVLIPWSIKTSQQSVKSYSNLIQYCQFWIPTFSVLVHI